MAPLYDTRLHLLRFTVLPSKEETPILRILYERRGAIRLFSFLSLSLSLPRRASPVITKLAFNEGTDGSGGAEAPPIPRHTGEKCRMYARRALSFSSRALAQLFRAFLLGARAAIGENPLLLGRGAPPAMKIRAAHSLCPPLYFCRAIYIGSSFVRVSRLWISRLPISRPPRADREFDFAPL